MKNILSSTTRTLAFGLGIIVLIAGLAWGIRTLRPGVEATQPAQQPARYPGCHGSGNRTVSASDPAAATNRAITNTGHSGAAGLFPTTSFNFPDGFPSAQRRSTYTACSYPKL